MFKRVDRTPSSIIEKSFNPSVGILSVQACELWRYLGQREVFQSLGRDSGCSSEQYYIVPACAFVVSIPRSGFWVFKLTGKTRQTRGKFGFNPSVGILGVQAPPILGETSEFYTFQSLGRDSGCSSISAKEDYAQGLEVSIPRSGFWVFKPGAGPAPPRPCRSFNPSVGILGVQAGGEEVGYVVGLIVSIPRSGFWVFKHALQQAQGHPIEKFQSLGRDSGCSSDEPMARLHPKWRVSIPRSGFWVFKHHAEG